MNKCAAVACIAATIVLTFIGIIEGCVLKEFYKTLSGETAFAHNASISIITKFKNGSSKIGTAGYLTILGVRGLSSAGHVCVSILSDNASSVRLLFEDKDVKYVNGELDDLKKRVKIHPLWRGYPSHDACFIGDVNISELKPLRLSNKTIVNGMRLFGVSKNHLNLTTSTTCLVQSSELFKFVIVTDCNGYFGKSGTNFMDDHGDVIGIESEGYSMIETVTTECQSLIDKIFYGFFEMSQQSQYINVRRCVEETALAINNMYLALVPASFLLEIVSKLEHVPPGLPDSVDNALPKSNDNL